MLMTRLSTKSNQERAPTTLANASPPQKSTPDPDLPNVEKAILQATEHALLHKNSSDGDRRDISEHITDLLLDALVKDVATCKVHLLSDTLSVFKKDDTRNATVKRTRSSSGERDEAIQEHPDASHSRASTMSDHGLERVLSTRARRGPKSNGPSVLKYAGASATTSRRGMKLLRKRERAASPAAKLRSQAVETLSPAPKAMSRTFKPTDNCLKASGGAGNGMSKGKFSKLSNESVEGEHEVTHTGSGVVASASAEDVEINSTRKQSPSANLPWWRSVESRMSLPMRHVKDEDVLRGYIMTLIRSCVRESWKAENLRESYDQDPSSIQGRAFLAVSSSLLMMERARHMGQCRMKWRAELVRELLHRRDIEWSSMEFDSSFRQFVGCEVCLAYRPATKCLKLKGTKYDARDFWPTNSVVDVLSTDEEPGLLCLAVELAPGCRPGQATHDDDDDETEFWVDEQCLRKCLVFHELVHSTSILTEDIMYMVEDELRDGIMMIPRSPDWRESGATVVEVLESHLVDVLSGKEDFMNRRISHFTDILHLGDVYFSAGDVEILDMDGEAKTGELPVGSQVYDAPTELNDKRYGDRVRKLESLTENKISGHPFRAFC